MAGKRILIIVPGENARGGITNYYNALKELFTLEVDYLIRGARNWPQHSNHISESFRMISDLCMFFFRVSSGNYALVQTTTSFSSKAVLRDALYIIIAKLFRLKVIVFIRGWEYGFDVKLEKRYLSLIKGIYYRYSDAIIELSESNIARHIQWGYKKKIYLETTLVDKNLLKNIDEESIASKYDTSGNEYSILFLARVEVTKGVYEMVETIRLLKNRYKKIKLAIAGDGTETCNLKKSIEAELIENIIFLGFVEGNEKEKVLKDADFFFFPSYSEGMPTSVLEAMAFGLPVVTRKVGGLSDFFINGEHGFITESKDPKVFYELFVKLIDDCELSKKIAFNNYRYSKERFLSNQVVLRIEKIFTEVLMN
jgi:glycosyltransferase involved in cell wall biosynthesis